MRHIHAHQASLSFARERRNAEITAVVERFAARRLGGVRQGENP